VEEKDYEALVGLHGAFLGRTDEEGELTHAFAEPGGYLLVAVKRGYLPGFTPIGIGNTSRALAIDAPRAARVGEPVTLTVFLRGALEPVEDAGIWALTQDEAEVLKEEMAALRQDTSISAEEKDYEALISVHGSLLGRTNDNGQLRHAFSEPGRYFLVAVKSGHHPGFTSIGIRDIPEPGVLPEQSVTR
jgi:hypothetical protein